MRGGTGGAPLPASDWLSRDPLTHWTADADVALKKLVDYRDHPIVQRIYPAEVIDTTRQLCKERPLFLEGLHRLPQTLCHQDVFRRNLFAQDDHTLAIDWEMMGIGAVGEDLAGLVSANLALREVDPAQGDALDKVVLSGYMDGLRDIGWQGDADLVRFGYTAASALRYGLCLIEPLVSIATDEGAQAFWTEELGCTLDELFEGQVMTRALWGRLTEEARRLIDRVGDRG